MFSTFTFYQHHFVLVTWGGGELDGCFVKVYFSFIIAQIIKQVLEKLENYALRFGQTKFLQEEMKLFDFSDLM